MATVEVPQTLKYRGGQLNAAPVLEVENFTNWKKRFMCHVIAGQKKPEAQWTTDERKAANLDQRLKSLIMSVLPDDQINSVINCLTAKSTWDDLILYHEGPSDVKESRVMDLKLCYNTFKFKDGKSLTQTFTRYKAPMNELVNDGIKLSKLEINTGFINGLPKKWLSFCQSLRNTNHVKYFELASLFGKLKYKENLINSIYETKKNKSIVSTTPLLTAFFSTSIVQDFQDSPDDEEDTRSSHEYLNDLKEEYYARALLAKFKRFFKKGTQRFNSAKATDQTECHKCGKKGHFDDEEVSSDKNEVTEVKALMALTDEERVSVGKESVRNGDWTKISMKKLLVLKQAKLDLLTMQHVNTEILKENQNLKFKLKELTSTTETWLNSSNIVNQCINEQIPTQKKKILGSDQLTEDTSNFESKEPVFVKSSVDNSDMPITNTNESSVCSTPLILLKKLDGVEPVSGPKTIKSILKSKSTFKAETLKGIIINEPSSALARGKSSSASKTNSAPAGKLKNMKMEDDPPLAIVMKPLWKLKLQIHKKKNILLRNKKLHSNVHTTSDHNDIEWFRKRETLQAKNAESFKESKNELTSALRSKTPTKRCPHLLLQILDQKKSKRGISINKEKDVNDLLRIYDKIGSPVNTPIMPLNMLGPDLNSKAANESQYKGIIGPLMNLTASRPNIQFSTETEDIAAAGLTGGNINIECLMSACKRGMSTLWEFVCRLRWKIDDKSTNMYKEYLAEFWYSAKALKNSKVSFSIPTGGIFREVGVNTFRNAIGAHYISHSSEYVAPPSIDVVRQWFPMIGYAEEVSAKETLRKSLIPPMWRLLMA
ncbi:hypothetical protein Tco_0894971 [Tanacetum coccineum]|uniref:Uncharacterized protein n=1 Tax=Tanacetum coccineum TaxID=301880 RepID=A0ABQ5CJI2_9ASTR